jgi:hypothetical protein
METPTNPFTEIDRTFKYLQEDVNKVLLTIKKPEDILSRELSFKESVQLAKAEITRVVSVYGANKYIALDLIAKIKSHNKYIKLLYDTNITPHIKKGTPEKPQLVLGFVPMNMLVEITQLDFFIHDLVKEISKNNSVYTEGISNDAINKIVADIQNNFDNTDITTIFNHFKTSLVDKKHLSEGELIEYLKAAFQDQIVPSVRFKIEKPQSKQKIIKVFYTYYKEVAGKPHGKQNQYAALLGDYFEGYVTKNVITNFNK